MLATRRTAEAAEERAAERRALTEAETARRELEAVIRHLPVGVIIAEAPSGRLLMGNHEVERIWRRDFHTAGEISDYTIYRGFHPEDRRPYAPQEWPLARSVASGEIVERERIDILRGDGSYGAIEVNSCPIVDEAGQVVSAVVTFDDVSDRIAAERAAQLLARTSELLDASLDVEETIERITRLVVPTLGDVCAVYLAEEERAARRIAVAGADPIFDELVADMLGREPVDAADERGAIGAVIRRGRSILLEDMTREATAEVAEDQRQIDLLTSLELNSTAVVPLRARGVNLGAVLIGAFGDRRRLTAGELPLIEDIARRAALALDNARLYAEEHRNAALLQRSLLPERLPELDSADVAARYVAAGARAQVGGDWYDAIALPDGAVGLVIGDVAGHGLRAAATMGRLRQALRAFALDGEPPGTVLERLNAFERRVGENEMATVFYAIHDPDEGTLRCASAGHPWPLVLGTDGTVRRLEADRGLPIGVRSGSRFKETVEPLAPGETLLLYTDGLVERRDAVLDEGVERAARAARGAPRDVASLCDHVLEGALAEHGSDDDIALLAFRPLAERAGRFDARLPAEPESLGRLRRRLRRWLRDVASPADAEEIVIACGEACANAIEHAYGPGEEQLEVSGEIDGDRVEIVIRDRGRWREGTSDDRGLGMTIMSALMDDVDVVVDGEGTRVRMLRRLRSSASRDGA